METVQSYEYLGIWLDSSLTSKYVKQMAYSAEQNSCPYKIMEALLKNHLCSVSVKTRVMSLLTRNLLPSSFYVVPHGELDQYKDSKLLKNAGRTAESHKVSFKRMLRM